MYSWADNNPHTGCGWKTIEFESPRGEMWRFTCSLSGQDALRTMMKQKHDAELKTIAHAMTLNLCPGGSPVTTGPRGVWNPLHLSDYQTTFLLTDIPKLKFILENYAFEPKSGFMAFPIRDRTVFISKAWFVELVETISKTG